MAASVVTPTVVTHNAVGKWDLIIGTLAIAAGDYAANGLTVSFSTNHEIKSGKPPSIMLVNGKAGYIYKYNAGATKDVGKLMIFDETGADGPLSELAAAATPAAVVADTIEFMAYFPLFR